MTTTAQTFDAVQTAVIANRVDGVVREMTNTLLRSARSAVINSARDFSCAITTSDNRLLACAEGLPVHIFGAQLQTASMTRLHPDLAEGDAYLDNDPYVGSSHAADHTILVPVFIDGEHMFTAVAKAHQADIGNSIATTYHARARDVYEEGALLFPVVKVQENYQDRADVLRMCQYRIRVPEQWRGDYLAAVGATRIAERRLKALCEKYGKQAIKQFIDDWFAYSDSMMRAAIKKLPEQTLRNSGRHDPFLPFLPDGLPFNVEIDIRPDAAEIVVDMTDNIDNVDCGLNMTEATTTAAVMAGIFNCIGKEIPKNSGSFSPITVLLRDGAAVGKPKFPHSCSVATTNLTDRVVNCVGSAFAQLGDGYGLSEGAVGVGVGTSTVSGNDPRNGGAPFVNQIVVFANGGPASAEADGWLTFGLPVISGLMYRDSIEIDEIKMPLLYRHVRVMKDSPGAGRYRGGAAVEAEFGPIGDEPITVIYPCDGQETSPKGVLGGADGQLAEGWVAKADGTRTKLPPNAEVQIQPGETIIGIDSSGSGYGDPLTRDPAAVLHDVVEKWISPEAAETSYGVVLVEGEHPGAYHIDQTATDRRRSAMTGTNR